MTFDGKQDVFYGNKQVKEVYIGSRLVWSGRPYPDGTLIYLTTPMSYYGTAGNALSNTSPAGTLATGNYYIIKYYDGAVALGRTAGVATGWVSSDANMVRA